MGALGFVVVIAIFWMIFSVAKPGSRGAYNTLLANGIQGRGILLGVSNMSLGTVGVGLFKYQQRGVTIDVEVPGRPPYECTVTALIPLNLVRDVLPGATVEVRVDPSNPNNIAIVGPGVGFNANTLMTQGQINQGAA